MGRTDGSQVDVAEAQLTIVNALGLHARAAAQLVKVANRCVCEVELECEGNTANGKSIMGVLFLAAAQGTVVRVTCRGEGAQACLSEISTLVASRFGEPR